MIEYLAMRWHHLDQQSSANPEKLWGPVSSKEKDAIRKRVRGLLDNKVVAESQADFLVTIGRHRGDEDIATITQNLRTAMHKAMWANENADLVNMLRSIEGIANRRGDAALVRMADELKKAIREDAGTAIPAYAGEVRWQPLWDALVGPNTVRWGKKVEPIAQCTRLFGNENIGSLGLTNLQVGGQMCGDMAYYASHWYIRTAGIEPETAAEFETALQNSVATFMIGHHPEQQVHLIDLFYERQPIGTIIPVRQNYGVEISCFNRSHEVFDRLLKTPLYVHFEGAQYRDVQ